jgi:hypothetical protein
MPAGVGDAQQPHQQISAVKRLTSAARQNGTCLLLAHAISPLHDDGNDLRVRAARAAPDDVTEREHLYRHFNEWSQAQEKQ